MMTKRIAALILSLLLLSSFALAQETRYAEVMDASADAGRLTARFVWLGPQVAEDKPGDSMILSSPDGKIMVLDAGHPLATDYVVAALDAMGVTKIDYLVASHPHIDHIGGFPALMDRYEIGAVYTSALTYESSSYYRAYIDAIAEHGLAHVILAEGDSFKFGEEIVVDVYNPPREIEYYDGHPKGGTQFINNHSLVLKMTYGQSTLLFAGDLYTAGEKTVVDKYGALLDCDVMKANHHGAATSSSLAWRQAVSPKLTFITGDTIEDLTIARKYIKNGQKMYHILMDGCIRLTTGGDGQYEVLTEKDRNTTLFD